MAGLDRKFVVVHTAEGWTRSPQLRIVPAGSLAKTSERAGLDGNGPTYLARDSRRPDLRIAGVALSHKYAVAWISSTATPGPNSALPFVSRRAGHAAPVSALPGLLTACRSAGSVRVSRVRAHHRPGQPLGSPCPRPPDRPPHVPLQNLHAASVPPPGDVGAQHECRARPRLRHPARKTSSRFRMLH